MYMRYRFNYIFILKPSTKFNPKETAAVINRPADASASVYLMSIIAHTQRCACTNFVVIVAQWLHWTIFLCEYIFTNLTASTGFHPLCVSLSYTRILQAHFESNLCTAANLSAAKI